MGPHPLATVPGFYHCSLIAILKEKVIDAAHAVHFHYEPFQLLWHPPHRNEDIKVHSKLFTSSVFLNAHRVLQ
jgi:hypothetical protein